MPSLRDTQVAFAAALFDGDASIAGAVRENGIDALQRLAIYRNQVQGTFERGLQLAHPTVAAVLGDDAFTALARSFMAKHPSRSGDLHDLGSNLAEYLASGADAAARVDAAVPVDAATLADLARLDRARHRALVADDAPLFDAAKLAAITPSELGNARLALHPSTTIVHVAHASFAQWCERPNSRGGTVECAVLIHRMERDAEGSRHSVHAREITPATAAFIATLERATLGDAFDAAKALDDSFDLGHALRRWVAAQVIVQVAMD